jgi:hypothetical protein
MRIITTWFDARTVNGALTSGGRAAQEVVESILSLG